MPDRRVAVVGAGLAGLSAALEFHRAGGYEVQVLERSERTGGKVRTEHQMGLVLEGGPDSFLSRKPWAVEMCRQLGLSDELVPLAPSGRQSAIYWRGRLHPIPPGVLGVPGEPWAFVRSGLVSPIGKLRAGLDLVLPRAAEAGVDRPLGEVVERRLGKEVLHHLVEPLIGGIHASSAWAMDARATFPELLELERRDRSLLVGAGRLRRRQRGAAPSPVPAFQTLRGGLSQMVDALVGALPEDSIRLRTEVQSVESHGHGYRLTLTDGTSEEVEAVVLACEAGVSALLLQDIAPRAAVALFSVNYSSVAVVALAYAPEDFPDASGSGFVVPRDAGLDITAVTLVHNKWPHEAGGMRLVRCFVGGAHDDPLSRGDGEILEAVRKDIEQTLGVRTDPRLQRVFRWPQAMPQYAVGHLRRVEAAEEALSEHPRLRLAGAALRGVGMPDVIHSGQVAARAIREEFEGGE